MASPLVINSIYHYTKEQNCNENGIQKFRLCSLYSINILTFVISKSSRHKSGPKWLNLKIKFYMKGLIANLKSVEMPLLCTQCPVVDEFGHSATRIAKTKQGIGKV